MAGPPYLNSDGVTIYYTDDPYLTRVLIFYWPVTTTGSNISSRHRVTIFSRIGHASFPPFQVSPQSSYYGAVAQLSDERQREEIYRVMVFSLAKYFDTLPAASKENGFDFKHMTLYDDRHAGTIANKLCKVTNPNKVLEDVQSFYTSSSDLQPTPTRPTSSRSSTFSSDQKEALRLAMCEMVDTEERYVSKMHDLLFNIISEFREKSMTRPPSSNSPTDEALAKLFPSCLDAIFTVNRGFLESIREVLESTEDSALHSISLGDEEKYTSQDLLGIRAFSKVLCEWFPKFLYPYKEYLYAHIVFSTLLTTLMKNHAASSFSHRIREVGGEQRLRSMLMEPVQRLPRYSLLIDSMLTPLPNGDPSIKLLNKARDVVSDICAMETPVSKVLDSLSISYEEERAYRSLSPTKFLSSLATGEDMVVMRNVPRLAAPEEERESERDIIARDWGGKEREKDKEKPRGREWGGTGSLRRAWSRRVSPPKREPPPHQMPQMPVLKENVAPRGGNTSPLLLSSRQGNGNDQHQLGGELEKLRRENTALREMLDSCTCGAVDGGRGLQHSSHRNHLYR